MSVSRLFPLCRMELYPIADVQGENAEKSVQRHMHMQSDMYRTLLFSFCLVMNI